MNARDMLSPFIAGLLFGTGLIVSGMTDPLRIKAFLDITGAWSPAMLLVMGAAVGTALPAFLWVKRHRRTLAGMPVDIANRRPVDAPLVTGALVFGAGWGLSGVCPGPGLVVAAAGSTPALVFVAAMLAGLLISRHLRRDRARAAR